jgi:hypothetical protein
MSASTIIRLVARSVAVWRRGFVFAPAGARLRR